MTAYFTNDADSGVFAETADGLEPPTGGPWTEVTQAAYETAKDAAMAAAFAAIAAAGDADSSAAEAKAQAVWDEINGVHPDTALILAQLIYPPFTP